MLLKQKVCLLEPNLRKKEIHHFKKHKTHLVDIEVGRLQNYNEFSQIKLSEA